MALAPLLYNITFDSQTRILYFWDKAGHEIYHCEIPSPAPAVFDYFVFDNAENKITFGVANSMELIINELAPALPTVSVINGIVGSDSAYGTRNIPNGSSVYQWVNSGGWALVTVASGNVIAFQRIANSSNDNVKYSGFDAQITQDGYVQVTNNTGSSYSGAFYLATAVCSSSSATAITVYDSSNTPHNAFQYTSDGTDYYYVLDGTQTDWTDDLSSIGYRPVHKAYASTNKTDVYLLGANIDDETKQQ